MASDLIYREDAKVFVRHACYKKINPIDYLDEVPAADVRPVVKAHWIYHEDDYGDYYECSHCHDEYVVYEGDMCWRYCPTCGAEMEPNLDTTKGENHG